MNFYKRHLGDIMKACAHLSQGQMGAYDLLMDWCYANERPLPAVKADLYRIGRANAKAERENVDRVIAEFFVLTDAGYTQKRILEEIEKANVQAETNRRIAQEREDRKRARDKQRTEHESCDEPRTNRQPSQTPDTRHQTPESLQASQETETSKGLDTHRARVRGPSPTAVGEACKAMRDAGIPTTNSAHPELLALVEAGATAAMFGQAAGIAASKGKGFGYALGVLRGQLADAATPAKPGKGDPEARHQQNNHVAAEWLREQASQDGDPA